MRIMVVDDEKAQMNLLVEELEALEPESDIYGFNKPKEALEFAEKNEIDVAFLDIQMAQIDGITLAKKLKKIKPTVNIIFATAYGDYAFDAISMHASGYIMKPVTAKQIENELLNLRYPTAQPAGVGIRVVTFGPFDIFVNGESVHFGRAKSKEVLAYLVDRRGAGVTKKELAAVIFEDREYSRSTQDYINKILREMEKALKDVKASDMYIKKMNYYAVDTTKFTCDMYEYMEGKPEALNAFRGEYMTQYSWAEDSIGEFL